MTKDQFKKLFGKVLDGFEGDDLIYGQGDKDLMEKARAAQKTAQLFFTSINTDNFSDDFDDKGENFIKAYYELIHAINKKTGIKDFFYQHIAETGFTYLISGARNRADAQHRAWPLISDDLKDMALNNFQESEPQEPEDYDPEAELNEEYNEVDNADNRQQVTDNNEELNEEYNEVDNVDNRQQLTDNNEELNEEYNEVDNVDNRQQLTDNNEVLNENSRIGESMKGFIRDLEEARTMVNSKEYQNLITCLKNIDDPQFNREGITPNQSMAMKYVAINKCINAYLNHKGKDGVKPNAMKKLAAVERLNKFVSQKFNDLEFKDFQFNNTEISKTACKMFDEYNVYRDHLAEAYPAKAGFLPPATKKGERGEIAQRLNLNKESLAITDIRDADKCLRRISAKIQATGSSEEKKMLPKLDGIRNKLIGKDKEPVVAKKEGNVLH